MRPPGDSGPQLAGAAGSADLLDEIMAALRCLERLCEQARGPGKHHIFMCLNAARRNVAEAVAAVSLMPPNPNTSDATHE